MKVEKSKTGKLETAHPEIKSCAIKEPEIGESNSTETKKNKLLHNKVSETNDSIQMRSGKQPKKACDNLNTPIKKFKSKKSFTRGTDDASSGTSAAVEMGGIESKINGNLPPPPKKMRPGCVVFDSTATASRSSSSSATVSAYIASTSTQSSPSVAGSSGDPFESYARMLVEGLMGLPSHEQFPTVFEMLEQLQ